MSQSGATLVQLLKTREAAELLALSSRTLEKHRTYGTGPVYRKLGGRVVYDVVDLRTWVDKGDALLRPISVRTQSIRPNP